MQTTITTTLERSAALPFLLQFLESSSPAVMSEQTGGALTSTETGDGSVPPKTDSEEDEDETGEDE